MEISRVSREERALSASISETETSGPGDGYVSGPRKGREMLDHRWSSLQTGHGEGRATVVDGSMLRIFRDEANL